MATESCDACGASVSIAGGIANLWTFEADETRGLTIELEDGEEYFLCFACLDRLPPEPTPADVEALE